MHIYYFETMPNTEIFREMISRTEFKILEKSYNIQKEKSLQRIYTIVWCLTICWQWGSNKEQATDRDAKRKVNCDAAQTRQGRAVEMPFRRGSRDPAAAGGEIPYITSEDER